MISLELTWLCTGILYSFCLIQYALESWSFTKARQRSVILPVGLLFCASLPWWNTSPWVAALPLMLLLLAHARPGLALTNAGADYMLMILTFALFIRAGAESWQTASDGPLMFVGAVSIYSYLRAGWVKIIDPAWRDGSALLWSYKSSIYQTTAPWTRTQAKALSWLVISFELSSVICVFVPGWAPVFCVAGVVFHFANFYFLGLNRFFWTWLATYPALLSLHNSF